MTPKLIFTGILILLVMAAMAGQVAPVSAGFTPTPSATTTSIPPTATTTSIPPTATPTTRPVRTTAVPPTAIPPTTIPPTATPPLLLPVTGGPASGLDNIAIIAVSLAGVLVLVLAAISVVIRQSARTRSG